NSTLMISTTNQTHSLDSLNIDSSSNMDLKEFSLTVGNSGEDHALNGKIIGGHSSQLIKKGRGTMTLNGDHCSFEGKIIVNNGRVVLKKDIAGNIEVDGFPESSFEFHDDSSAASSEINIKRGKVVFKDKSSANSARITVADGELAFQDSSRGNKANVYLSEKAKLSIAQDNSLGSIHTDSHSTIFLNKYALTIGSLDQEDVLKGE